MENQQHIKSSNTDSRSTDVYRAEETKRTLPEILHHAECIVKLLVRYFVSPYGDDINIHRVNGRAASFGGAGAGSATRDSSVFAVVDIAEDCV